MATNVLYRGRRIAHRVSEATVTELPFWDRVSLGKRFGVKPGTIKQYEVDSGPGGRYERDPFPKRDGTVNRGPWWRLERLPEFEEWFTRLRDRKGVGGRPRKAQPSE